MGNQVDGSFEADHWAKYDALPPSWRRLLQRAPVNVKVGWINDLRRGFGDEKAWPMVQRRIRDYTLDGTLKLYGRAHPQARR